MNIVIDQLHPDYPDLLVCVDSKGTATVVPLHVDPDTFATSTTTETFPPKPIPED